MGSELLGELVGTFVLILFGSGVGCSINLKKTYAKAVGANWVLVGFGWGVAVMLGVYTAVFFGAPGHLNPAVTIGFAVGGIGGFSWGSVFPYIAVQMIGAFLGALLAAIHFWPHFNETPANEGNTVGCFATGPAIDNPIWNFLSETIATFAFIFTLLMLPAGIGDMTPFVLVFVLVAISFSFGSTTGYAINPARDLGPRLMYALIPVPNKNTDYNWSYAWIPIAGPIVGGTIAVLLFNILS